MGVHRNIARSEAATVAGRPTFASARLLPRGRVSGTRLVGRELRSNSWSSLWLRSLRRDSHRHHGPRPMQRGTRRKLARGLDRRDGLRLYRTEPATVSMAVVLGLLLYGGRAAATRPRA